MFAGGQKAVNIAKVCVNLFGRNTDSDKTVDGYDLPEALQEWLFPLDGSTRDFPTLQVVFGRGQEYFASDNNGKLEFKEPEIKKPQTPVEATPKEERPAPLRRSRTISFLRPLSDASSKSATPSIDMPVPGPSKSRSSSVSQVSSRPPSSVSSRPTSDALPNPYSPDPDTSSSQTSSRHSSWHSPSTSRPQSVISSRPTSDSSSTRSFSPVRDNSSKEAPDEAQTVLPTRLVRRSTRPLSMSFNPSTFSKIVEGKALSLESGRENGGEYHCSCCRHSPANKPSYADASIQTDPEPLRVDTGNEIPNHSFYSDQSSGLDSYTPLEDDLPPPPPPPNPVYMGRMLDYFGNPGYQLGDSLISSYHYYQEPMYYQQEVLYDSLDDKQQPV